MARVLLLAGWGAAAVSLLDPARQPFSALMILAGVLIAAGGIALGSDGGHAMARLDEHHAPSQPVPPYRWIARGLVFIGAVWLVAGVATTVG